ncbi:MAG: SUMF1/EgtB/PvdO family nonheme iron enzyme [bacterium]|nr:SUMF1/EgtB/PvdO family nonheme iron enzyme [bacterium]
MAQIFISYSRVDSPFVDKLIPRIQRGFPDLKIWYDKSPHGIIGGDNWWNEILRAIAESDIFVYILSNESVQSLYCQAEFTEARRLQKRIITIQARDRTERTEELDDLQWIDMTDWPDDPDAFPSLTAAINKQLSLAKKLRPLWKPATPRPGKEASPTRDFDAPTIETPPLLRPSAEDEAIRIAKITLRWQVIGVITAILLGVLALVVPLLTNREDSPTRIAQVSDTPPPASAMSAPIPASNANLAVTPTLSGFEELQTVQAQQTLSASTREAFDLTATVQFVADGSATAAAQQFAITETAARMTLVALSATATATPTSTPIPPTATATPRPTNTPPPTLSPEQIALTPQTSNAAWQPYITERDFGDGVPMVLVPAGCFMMGSEDGNEDEQPVHEVCFEEPFWIDRYEVRQGDFERLGGVKANENGFNGENRPVERITWFEARDFCVLRGARLPSEAEWEYAARGPDNLVYPWGNQFVADNGVFSDNSNSQTAEVGSRPGGMSWVGAYDLSGNVWEWVNTVYGIDDGDFDFSENGERRFAYPYSDSDGREQDSESRTYVRVLRGGSWVINVDYLRSASRYGGDPVGWGNGFGFRCSRS